MLNDIAFSSKVIKTSTVNNARVMRVETAHGGFDTPTFMPVGTRAFVNDMTTDDLKDAGSQIILGGNTYHMLCAPGMEVVHAGGGMHEFMDWSGPMLTDSGGFQVFSLSKNSDICTIDEEGAHFKHPITGNVINMPPEVSLKTQKTIGADIIMAFDQCTPSDTDRDLVKAAMERTHRWLLASKEYHEQNPNSDYGYSQALFGIVQGGIIRDLREQSAQFVASLDLDGIALGGEAIGFDMAKTSEILDWVRPILPSDKVRYTMGVGLHPQDLIDAVASGADIFDCVAPTRNARHGTLYCGEIVYRDGWLAFESTEPRSKINIKQAKYARDEAPVMQDCDCFTCTNYSRAHLHDLFKSKKPTYGNLAAIHNIHVMHSVCHAMRKIIA